MNVNIKFNTVYLNYWYSFTFSSIYDIFLIRIFSSTKNYNYYSTLNIIFIFTNYLFD